jgi:hypothetical protein
VPFSKRNQQVHFRFRSSGLLSDADPFVWCERFGRTQAELEIAIKETGSVIADDIGTYLETKKPAAETR